jgi:predicted cobalt transporter CbtA
MAGQHDAASRDGARSSRRRYWNWLLVLPLVLLVYPGLYARSTPELFGFPFFYWYQFAVVIATALLTGVVYWATRAREDEGSGS